MSTATPPADARSRSLRLWDERTGPEMFWLSILSLVLLAGMFHINDRPQHMAIFNGCLLGFLGLYPAYWVDCFWAMRLRSRDRGYHWFYALFPPFRLGAKDHEKITGSGFPAWAGNTSVLNWSDGFSVPFVFL